MNWFVGADFSALELRIVGLLSGDAKLLAWYNEGIDVHSQTAKALFSTQAPSSIQRDLAKTVAYGVNYNQSDDVTAIWKTAQAKLPKKLAELLTIARLKKFRDIWFKEHPWIKQWQRDTVRRAEKLGYVEAPISGRRRYFYDRQVDPNEALNFGVQATAADLANRAILKLDKALPKNSHIVAQVHDAIYVEGPDPDLLAKLLRSSMTQTITLNNNTMTFPVDVGVARDWTCSLKFKDESSCFKDFFESLNQWFLPERSQAAA